MRYATFRLWAFLVLASAAASEALGQTGHFNGVTPVPADLYQFPASLIVTRSAPAGSPGALFPALYTQVTTDENTQSYEWANLTILNNYSKYGANVAVYSQANKRGNGPTWGGVIEAQDATGRGAVWGLEVDAFTTGASTFDQTGGGDRIGLGIVVGRAFNQGPKATVDYGLWVLPNGLDRATADVNFGVMVSTDCRYACFAMPAGNKIAWEESAQIASKLDPNTGRWGLYNGDKAVFEVDVATGQLYVGGRAVQITYK
jgi:hypothetical protein